MTFLRCRSNHIAIHCVILLFFSLLNWTCKKVSVKPSPDTLRNPAAVNNWTQFGGGPERVNARPFAVHPPLKNIWVYKASSAISSTMLAVDGVLYFTTLDGRFELLDIASGKRLGRGKCEGQHEAAFAYRNRYLFFAARYGENTLAKYDLFYGKYMWKINAGDIASEPLVTDDAVYVSAQYSHIDKYHFQSGEKIWTFKTEDQHHSSPALKDNVLVAGCDDGVIYALNSEDGKLKWKVETGASVFATPVLAGERVFVGSIDSTFYALNLSDGSTIWTFSSKNPIHQTAASDGQRILFGASDGQFYCLNADSGVELWRFHAQSAISTTPLIVDKVVYFGSLDRNYYCLDLESGALLWKFETKGRIRTSPIVWNNYIFGASEERFVYAFTPSDSTANDSF